MRKIRQLLMLAWPVVFGTLMVWQALATIAPGWFQVHQGPALTDLLLHPATARILIAVTVVWFGLYLWRLRTTVKEIAERPRPGSLDDVAPTLQAKGLLDAPTAKTPMTDSVTELNRLLFEGDRLLSKTKIIRTDNSEAASVECRHVGDEIARWENEAFAWLKRVKPGFEEDFMANFSTPTKADVREQLMHRIAIRLERLRSIKASIL